MASRRVLPTYTLLRHRWLTLLDLVPHSRRRWGRAPYACHVMGWTAWEGWPQGGEVLTETGRLQLALWNSEHGKVMP